MFERFWLLVPDAGTAVPALLAGTIWGALAALLVARVRRHGVRTAYTRKLYHFAIFTIAGAVHLWLGPPGVAAYGAGVVAVVLFGVWRGPGDWFYEALARPADEPRRTLFILVPLATTALGGVLANLFVPAFAHIGYLVCGWGDAVGEPVGARWGRHRYRVPGLAGVPATRSLEGSAAVFAVSVLAAFVGLVASGGAPARAAGAALAIAAAAAVVEAFSNHGLDNLTVQVAAAAVAAALLG
jgi:phytol kinase